MNSIDKNRYYFNMVLKEHGITIGSILYEQLCEFLMHPANNYYLQHYFLLCTGLLGKKDIDDHITDLIAELKFVLSNNYTYRHLFHKDPEWYEFYRENAYPTGDRRKADDPRRGVCKKIADIIMDYKNGPPALNSLEDAFMLHFQKKMD
jgi:hypothetical protein